jgi:hypothetical protein
MPFLGIERGHGAVADHTIGVPSPGLAGDRVAVDACTGCHAGGRTARPDAPRLGAEGLAEAYARWWPEARPRPWMQALAAARTARPEAHEALVSVLGQRDLPRLVRASAARLLERYAPASEPALLRATEDADSLVRRAALAALAAVPSEAASRRLLEALSDGSRGVRIAAARAALSGWERVRKDPALLAALLPVLEEDAGAVPDDDLRWFLLGAARELAGDTAGALRAYRRQLALDPFAHHVRRHVGELEAAAEVPGPK